jgi:hypothetical protein
MTEYDIGLGNAKDEFTEMLEGMTKQELVKYARMTFGLQVTAKYNKHDLVALVKDARGKFKMNDRLQLGDTVEDDGLRPGYAEIQIHRTELTKGMKTVIVGLNGQMASLPIGSKPFGCPLELVEVLQHAVRHEYEQDTTVDPPELIEREVHSYPFTIHKVNPHTDASKKAADKKRGIRGRPPIEERMAEKG